MPISGSFGRMQAVQQPYTGTPNQVGPDPNHGATKGTTPLGAPAASGPQQAFIGDNVNPTGGGFIGARGVQPTMNGGGIMRDFSRTTDDPNSGIPSYSGRFAQGTTALGAVSGSPVPASTAYRGVGPKDKTADQFGVVNHAGTAIIRKGLGAPAMSGGAYDSLGWTADLNRAAAGAHANMRTARIPGHEYSPLQAEMLGEAYGEDMQPVKGYGTAISGRAIVKGTIGGSFTDGTDQAEYTPTYADKVRASKDRRWAYAKYSSEATLVGGNSAHTLRGVLPNTIATPYPQPSISGGITNKNNVPPPNARFLGIPFTVPQLFRLPVPMSDNITVTNDGAAGGDNLGMGF